MRFGREDADDVGASADLLVEALLGIVGPDLAPDLFGKASECQQIRSGRFEVLDGLGELVGEHVDDPIIGLQWIQRQVGPTPSAAGY